MVLLLFLKYNSKYPRPNDTEMSEFAGEKCLLRALQRYEWLIL